MTKSTKMFSLISLIAATDNDPPAGDPPAGDPPAGDPPSGEVFTQEQVNAMMAKQKEKIKAQSQELVQGLQTQLDSFKGTAQEKTALQERIKNLKAENQTAAERAASKHSEAISAIQAELDTTKSRAEQGWNLYTEARSDASLIEAATKGEATSPSLVKRVLSPMTALEEVTNDEGQPTGNFKVVVSLPVLQEDGSTKTMKLSAAEAIAAMKKMPEYGPLFKSTATGGTGGANAGGAGGGGSTDLGSADMAALAVSNPEAYKAAYAKQMGLGKHGQNK